MSFLEELSEKVWANPCGRARSDVQPREKALTQTLKNAREGAAAGFFVAVTKAVWPQVWKMALKHGSC